MPLSTAPDADAAVLKARPQIPVPVAVQASDRAAALCRVQLLIVVKVTASVLLLGGCDLPLWTTPRTSNILAMPLTCVAPVVRLCTGMPAQVAPSYHHTSSCGSDAVLPMSRTHWTCDAFSAVLHRTLD